MNKPISLALFQPDMAPNAGAAMRLCAALGVSLHIIEPCGFPWDDRKIRRTGMDYVDQVDLTRHAAWDRFISAQALNRIVLLTTKADMVYTDFTFKADDIILAGRESAGVPDNVHNAAAARVIIPMQPGLRSLNVVNACAMVLGEALRQVK